MGIFLPVHLSTCPLVLLSSFHHFLYVELRFTLVRSLLGIQQGLQQGKQEGKLEGKQEGKLETVTLLRQLGLSVEEIATRLELPLEDVIKASQS